MDTLSTVVYGIQVGVHLVNSLSLNLSLSLVLLRVSYD